VPAFAADASDTGSCSDTDCSSIYSHSISGSSVLEIETGDVPETLERDYSILHALLMCVNRRGGNLLGFTVALDDITKMSRKFAPILRQLSASSLTQAVGHVCKRIVQHMKTKVKGSRVEYTTHRRAGTGGRVRSIVCDASGVTELRTQLSDILAQMRSDPAFANEWHASRAARDHARIVADRLR
jgi:hypothetical protein